MANALFLLPASGTAAATSAQAGTPATNLTDKQPSRLWRSSSTSSQHLQFTADIAVAARAFAVINNNLSSSATLVLKASNVSLANAQSSGTTLYSGSAWVGSKPGATWKNQIAFGTFANSTAYLYFDLAITDGAPAASYFEAGRLMIGGIFQPSTINLSGVGRESFSADPQTPSPYNQTFTERRGNVGRIMTPAWAMADSDEVETGFLELPRLCGNGGDFLFSIDPADASYFPQRTMQCVFSGNPKVSDVPYFNGGKQMWQLAMTLKELV